MSVGEYTVSNIAMDEDQREANKKNNTVDMTKLTADIAAQVEVATAGKVHEALEGLLSLEKMSRLAEDVTATKACCTAVLQVCYQAKQWKLLEEHVLLLAKRRSQLKQAIQAFVRQAMGYIDDAPDIKAKVSLITTLQAVTEGKIFVEIERARLTRRLAAMREAEGKVAEAADILQEVPVETFGAMAKTEKIAYILEQVRLCLDKQDFIRAQILSRKISPRAFVQRRGEAQGEVGIEGTTIEAPEAGIPTLPELKLKYYQLMIRYHTHDNNYLECTRCYKAIYEIDTVQADSAQWQAALKRICWYIVLAPAYSTEQGSSSDRATLLANTLQDKKLSDLPGYKALLTTFSTHEIVRWPVFQQSQQDEITALSDVFSSPKRIEDLKLRVNEHNVMVVAKYYTCITTHRLAELLDLTADETETHLSTMVVAKAVSAKIDRPAYLVSFGAAQEPEDALNSWAANISKLLGLVEVSSQKIAKECMLHKVVLAQ